MRQEGLFGERAPKPVSPAKKLLDEYAVMFRERFGYAPDICGGRDMKMLKELVGLWGEEETRELIRRLMVSEAWYISDRSIKNLRAAAQSLRMEGTGVSKSDRRTLANANVIQRAMRGLPTGED